MPAGARLVGVAIGAAHTGVAHGARPARLSRPNVHSLTSAAKLAQKHLGPLGQRGGGRGRGRPLLLKVSSLLGHPQLPPRRGPPGEEQRPLIHRDGRIIHLARATHCSWRFTGFARRSIAGVLCPRPHAQTARRSVATRNQMQCAKCGSTICVRVMLAFVSTEPPAGGKNRLGLAWCPCSPRSGFGSSFHRRRK